MAPSEVGLPTPRRAMLTQQPDLNDTVLLSELDFLEEQRDHSLLRIQNYQQLASKYYNRRVRGRFFTEGDLVNAGKLGAHWEGPYLISKVVKPGVYELVTMTGDAIPRSWNSINLKRFYY